MRKLISNLNIGAALALALLACPASFSLADVGVLTCQALFSQTPGAIRPDYAWETHYSKVVPVSEVAKNQCNLGTCHITSWEHWLESESLGRGGAAPTISGDYLAFMFWRERAIKALADLDADDVVFGADLEMSREFILRAGLWPQEAWTWGSSFRQHTDVPRTSAKIKSIIDETHASLAAATSDSSRARIVKAAEKRIRAIFDEIANDVPKNFIYRGRKYSPQKFAAEFYPELSKPLVNAYIWWDPENSTDIQRGDGSTKVWTNIAEVTRMVRESIDNGHAVYLSYDSTQKFVNHRTGLMSIDGIVQPHHLRPKSRLERAEAKSWYGSHGVLIVGYEVDANGHVVRWKIRNTWGPLAGDAGDYHMQNDYFEALADGIAFFADSGVRLPTVH